MFTKEFLQEQTVKQLRDIAKEKNISGRWDMTKPKLIEAILSSQNVQYSKLNATMGYVESIQPGALVAFKTNSKKGINTAKVVKKSTKNRKLKLVTQYGAEFIVPYEDVIWVKTGTRWPKGIYKILKGVENV